MRLILSIVCALFFSACSSKSDSKIYNLPPNQWYELINERIEQQDLEAADKYFASFVSEHIASPLLENTILILAQAHMNDENYQQSNRYIDEYIQRYANYENLEYAKFLKIKANYESFIRPNRNQALMEQSIIQIYRFIQEYPNSKYRPLVESMLVKFELAKYYLDQNIRDLYKRTGRTVSEEIYNQKLNKSALKDANLQKPKMPWWQRILE